MATNPQMMLDDEEDTAVPLQRGTNGGEAMNEQLCLVGRFLTKKPIRTHIMKDRLAAIWQPGRGVNIKVLDSNLFLFQFYHWRDVNKILSGGPWHFDGHMLLLSQLQVGDVPNQVPLFHTAFWVQVHDVPIGFMTEEVGRILGDFIGSFMEYDPKNSSDFWKSFMRIRVAVDVRKPLRRGKKINVGGDNIKVVRFKYERLSVFCYLCGALGHLDNSCDKLFDMEHDDGTRGWGPELKVERRVPGENNEWLRQEKGNGGVSAEQSSRPATASQAERHNSNDGINAEERFQALNLRNSPIMRERNDSPNNGNNAQRSIAINRAPSNARRTTGISINSLNGAGSSVVQPMVHFMDSTPLIPPNVVQRDGMHDLHGKNVALPLENMQPDLEEARKRKRIDGSVMSNASHDTTSQKAHGDHFLLAGPGTQACQEK